MEQDIQVGNVGKLELVFAAGKASLGFAGKVGAAGPVINVSVVEDAGALIDLIEAAVAKAIPASAPLDPMIFGALKNVVLGIK